MANPAALERLRRGVGAWNHWRAAASEKLDLDLSGAELDDADLKGADFQGTNLTGASLASADLTRACLRNAYLSESDLSEAQLQDADLTGAHLSRATLWQTRLRGADLSGASLLQARMWNVILDGAMMRGTELSGAMITHGSLDRADLTDARLLGASFVNVDFSGVDVSRALVGNTGFSYCRLGGATTLDTCIHSGPSFIDVHTLTLSTSLPLAFLQGCGVPDLLIDYLPSLRGSAIDFYSVFISYASADEDFANRLHADLQSRGIRCWFAPHDIQAGKKLHEQIDTAIRLFDKMLLILSPHSMSSRWVKTEIAKARKKEREQNRVVMFPVSLVPFADVKAWEQFDGDMGDDSAKEIREYFIPDFSTWKRDHDAYSRAFDRLVKDLKATVAQR